MIRWQLVLLASHIDLWVQFTVQYSIQYSAQYTVHVITKQVCGVSNVHSWPVKTKNCIGVSKPNTFHQVLHCTGRIYQGRHPEKKAAYFWTLSVQPESKSFGVVFFGLSFGHFQEKGGGLNPFQKCWDSFQVVFRYFFRLF